MAVIVAKDEHGRALIMRSSRVPPTPDEEKRAVELDSILASRVPEIEDELVRERLLPEQVPSEHGPSSRGDIKTWWELGVRLSSILKNGRLVQAAELPWVYEAIGMYASRRIARKDRGPSRLHLDYCVQIAELPWEYVRNLTWADWVFCMDSKGLRGEPRFRLWLKRRIGIVCQLGRKGFRELIKEMNAKFRGKDSSVFADEELFERYESTLAGVCSQSTAEDTGRHS